MLDEPIDAIRSLLIAHRNENKFIAECLAVLDDESVRTGKTGEVPIGELISSAAVREKINTLRGNPINGFEDFMSSIKSDDTELVVVISIIANMGEYIVFTNPSRDRIIGILHFKNDTGIEEC